MSQLGLITINVGDHGREYVIKETVAVLNKYGWNSAANMNVGIANDFMRIQNSDR